MAETFAEQLEQAAKEYREAAKDNRMCANTARALGGGDTSAYDWPAEKEEQIAALLTRAAALARAAEKVIEKWPDDSIIDEAAIHLSVRLNGHFYEGPSIADEMRALRALTSDSKGE